MNKTNWERLMNESANKVFKEWQSVAKPGSDVIDFIRWLKSPTASRYQRLPDWMKSGAPVWNGDLETFGIIRSVSDWDNTTRKYTINVKQQGGTYHYDAYMGPNVGCVLQHANVVPWDAGDARSHIGDEIKNKQDGSTTRISHIVVSSRDGLPLIHFTTGGASGSDTVLLVYEMMNGDPCGTFRGLTIKEAI